MSRRERRNRSIATAAFGLVAAGAIAATAIAGSSAARPDGSSRLERARSAPTHAEVRENAKQKSAAEGTGTLAYFLALREAEVDAAWDAMHQHEVDLFNQAVEANQRAAAARSAPGPANRGGTAQAPRGRTSPAAGGGSCGVPADNGEAPPGFPASVIQKESGGDRNASNGSHFGRAQISCQHYGNGGGCVGLSYSECWAKLWNNGAGASNWSETIGR